MNNNSVICLKLPIVRMIFAFIPSKLRLKIAKKSKNLQNKLNMTLGEYKIFKEYSSKHIDILNSEKLSLFYESMIYKTKLTMDEIEFAICYCLLDSLKENEMEIDLSYEELFNVYYKMKKEFNIKLNVIVNEKIIKNDNFSNKNVQLFMKNKMNNCINGINFNQLSSNSISNIINRQYDLLELFEQCDKVSFSKIKFKTTDMILLQMFNEKYEIEKINFYSVNLSLNCYQVIPKYCSLNLIQLEISYSRLTDNQIEIMLKSSDKLQNVKILNLEGNKITNVGIVMLSTSIIAMGIKKLNVSYNYLTGDSVNCIINSAWKLEELNISNNKIGNDFIDLFQWDNNELKKLNISNINNNISSPILFPSNALKLLTHLKFSHNQITSELLCFFFSIYSIISLDLVNCSLTSSLLNFNFKTNVQYLNIKQNPIDISFLKTFLLNPSLFPHLYQVDVHNTKINSLESIDTNITISY